MLDFTVSLRARRVLTLVFFTTVLVHCAAAIGADKCGSLGRSVNAIRLAKVLYPDLENGEFSLQFSEGTGGPLSSATDVRTFLIVVDKPQWHPPNIPAPPPSGSAPALSEHNDIHLPLYLHFEFLDLSSGDSHPNCRPTAFRNDSEFGTASTPMEPVTKVRALINAHPEWTETQELEAATKLGMRYGPDQRSALLQLIPLKGLSLVYGPLRITDAKFSTTGNNDKAANSAFADLHWHVDAHGVGTSRSLQIFVEPFDGKVVALNTTE